jgi:hypothetical protein
VKEGKKSKRGKQQQPEHDTRTEPTPYELAKLAATLLSAKDSRYQLAETWVKEALALWLTAREVLEKWRTSPTSVFPEPERAPEPEPTPKTFPVTLDKFLSLMLPHLNGKSAEKHFIFREYLAYRMRNPSPAQQTWAYPNQPHDRQQFDCCNPEIVPLLDDLGMLHALKMELPKPLEATQENVVKYYTLWNTQGIQYPHSFCYHRMHFREWYRKRHGNTKAENALKGHAKRTLRKRLWEKSCKDDPTAKISLRNSPKVTGEQMARLLQLNEGRPLKDYKNWDYNIGGD